MPGMGARSPEDHKQEVAALKAVRISAAAVSCFFSFLVQCFVFRRFFFFFFSFQFFVEIRVASACPGHVVLVFLVVLAAR